MIKSDAIKQLIADFQNNLIQQGYTSIDSIDDETDRKIAKSLKIELNGG